MAPRVERLAVAAVQLGLVVERVHLADAAVHEELDHPADLGAMMQPSVEVGARRGCAGVRSVPASRPSRPSMAARAMPPRPPPSRQRKSRRGIWSSHGVARRSVQFTNKNSLLLKISRHRFARPWRAA